MIFQFRRLIIIMLALAAALAGRLATAQPSDPVETSRLEAAEALLERWRGGAGPGLAVSVLRDGETVFSAGAGLANLEYAVPIGPDTPVHAASVSKQFTAFSIMLLADDGLLALDDDIRTYLPGLHARPETVTIRHLLDHMGGYREQSTLFGMAGWRGDDVTTQAQQWRLLARQRGANFQAGAHMEYSNTGYAMLARIVERVSGLSFEEFTRTRIFDPLGMDATRFYTDPSRPLPGRAWSYAPDGDGYAFQPFNYQLVGSTGLQTSTADLLLWAENFETRSIGSDAVFAMMAERATAGDGQASTFARGQERRTFHGLDTWSHGGRDAGFRAFLLRVPEAHFAVSVLANRSDIDAAEIAFAMFDVFLADAPGYEAEPLPVWEPATPGQLAAYSGDYEIFPGLIFTISTDGEGLFFAPRGSGQGSPMPQIGEHVFSLNPGLNIAVEFVVDPEGAVTAFNYVIGLNGSIPAPRIELAPFDAEGLDLSVYTGRYYSEELVAEYEVSLEDGVLRATHLRLPVIELSPYQSDIFAGDSSSVRKVEFVRGPDGTVIGCRISGALANDVGFARLP